jgi:hypothetical protein
MRLTTRMHGTADYLVGAALLILPWVGGFGSDAAGVVAMIFGAAVIAHALVTNFEMGVLRLIQVPLHLWLDGVGGLLLALSPWLIGFDRTAWIPHVALGGVLILSALLTDTVPVRDRRASGSAAPR